MSEGAADFESLLRRALAPVEPPAELELRLEATLGALVELAADELEAWEMGAMQDPRNWLRPAAALVVGSSAAAGLVVLRTQRKRHKRLRESRNVFELAERTMRDAAQEATRLFEDAWPRR